MKLASIALAAGLAVSSPALAADMLDQAPPPAPFQKVSSLVKLPDFIPGIGDLYVDPSDFPGRTLPRLRSRWQARVDDLHDPDR